MDVFSIAMDRGGALRKQVRMASCPVCPWRKFSIICDGRGQGLMRGNPHALVDCQGIVYQNLTCWKVQWSICLQRWGPLEEYLRKGGPKHERDIDVDEEREKGGW